MVLNFATGAKAESVMSDVDEGLGDAQQTGRNVSLAELAYDRIEAMLVHFRLRPGADLKMQELQALVELGRTPVHQAVRRLAAETLLIIRPRDGLQISPINLTRDRRLLQLRRDMDRFVVRLAAEQLSSNHRNQMLALLRRMIDRRTVMELAEFNDYDRLLDQMMLAAAGEPFLDRTLRPLHVIFRRIGWLHLSKIGGKAGLIETIDRHIAVLETVSARNAVAAEQASDELLRFADSLFDDLETQIDPGLLDARAAPLVGPGLLRVSA